MPFRKRRSHQRNHRLAAVHFSSHWHIRRWILCAIFLILFWCGCDRPFVEEATPDIRVLEPDLSEVLVDSDVQFRFRVSSFRAVERVLLNNVPMTRSENADDEWELQYVVRRGVNTLVVEAIDIADVASTDTIRALHLPFAFALNAPQLPQGRAGHTATLLESDGLLITGGAARVRGAAQRDAFLLRSRARTFTFSRDRLLYARTGHTATRLPDGRVLILGGSSTDEPASVDDLVENAEIYDEETDSFYGLPVVGQPIRRAYHTAVLRPSNGRVLVDLYGGRGDTRYGSDPFLGVRRDLRTFEVLRDTVFAQNELVTAPYLGDAIYGHTATRLASGSYLILGAHFERDFTDEVSFRMEYNNTPTGIRITDAPPMRVPRTRYAAARVQGNLLMIFGGRQETPQSILIDAEVYSEGANRVFSVPRRQAIVRRFGHTATSMSSRQVLLVGGFGRDGTSYLASEFFSIVQPDE